MIKNDFENLFIYFFVTLGVFSIVTIAFNYNSFLGFILSIIIFGRLQIYYSEILHEATHFNFFRSFKLNSLISNIILYPFLLITVEKNRKSHFAHHKYPSLPYRDLYKLAEEKMIPKDNCLSIIKLLV